MSNFNIPEQIKALDILKNYQGNNPFILRLKRNAFLRGDQKSIGPIQLEFVFRNHNKEVRPINKIVKLADWYSKKKKEDWGLDFLPNKIKIISYLGDTEEFYCCMIQYRKSVDPEIKLIPKKAILTDFLAEDYKKKEIDFERYDKLSNYKRVLLPHQKEAVKFLLARKKCILADEQGLGKTTSISVAAIEGNFDSILVICPASLKTNWKRELSFYVPERDITVIDGFADKKKEELEKFLGYGEGKSGKTRAELIKEAKENGKWSDNRFVILNYDILDEFYKIATTRKKIDIEEALKNSQIYQYLHNKKSLLIIDEAHLLSDSKSIRYKVVKNIIKRGEPDSIYLATGTPLTNAPENLYCVLNLLGTEVTENWAEYMKRYCGAREFCHPKDKEKRNRLSEQFIRKCGKKKWVELSKEQKDKLADIIKKNCRMLLVPQSDNLENLEELKERIAHLYLRRTKSELTLPTKTVHEIFYDLTLEQEVEYNKLWDEYEEANKQEDKELNKELLEGGIYKRYLSNEMVKNTIKLTNSMLEQGRKVVIACCYDEELYTLADYYKDNGVIYNGKMTLKQKDSAIESFMNDDKINVFIGNIISASVGITLISSNCLIFNDFSYVPSDCLQMEDRVHRIGQTKPCDIYYQIFRNTQYERMLDIVLRKRGIIDTVIKEEKDK